MSALTVQHEPRGGDSWEELVRLWHETDAPEGCKVEIIEGIVTVAPPPVGKHSLIAAKLLRCLIAVIPEEWDFHQTLGVAIPSRSGLYIPDLLVAPDDVVESAPFIPAAAAELVVEITSPSNASHDRIAKAAGYAHGGVPLYLLIDAFAPGGPTITLYGEPANGVYRVLQAGKFGDTFRLPAPFDVELDTSVFPTP
ncbi:MULTISPECIES: Uma2 family endonuclease [unclassified Streptomyces]|uniref:Uma2 family endonuclease n=1 Tax=unclassified Streptomyces TaxID=2593676 RepID=UPI001BE69C7A|nr:MULTISPECIES: Uma2 family endonuclease [unclassified Streptomyces]MBT2402324.1 Uma2 family endonuclease [Streptomyces sp. ISL-21]MBT2455275.1 Uma2 family endonuclease [Streptomyces sp. ISL-86]MBT2607656.1 Uma2 family endonuclease [Streptomyces sp. ISL-87]